MWPEGVDKEPTDNGPGEYGHFAFEFDERLGRFMVLPENLRFKPVRFARVIASSQLLYRLCCLFPIRLDTTTWEGR